MTTYNNLQRFLEAQQTTFASALAEIESGRKQTHWMWFIFPQLQDLGYSSTAKLYGIKDISEAEDYLQHKTLGTRLVSISKALLALPANDATSVLGSPDDMKLKSCMTLFSLLKNTDPVFEMVLKKFFNGTRDTKTLDIIGRL